jgi:flagellar assembly protein FliH
MAAIIKASESSESTVEFAFDDLGDPERSDLKNAGRRAAKMLAEAETQAAELYRQAEQQGRVAAQAAAQQVLDEKVVRRVDMLLPALRASVEEIRAAKAQWLAHWEKAALDVATAIAARVIRREVQQTPDITIGLVKEALELAGSGAEVQLRMHPDDLATLGSQVERLIAELGRLGEATIVADAEITRGGCRADTRFGSIDQQIESQLARIAQELT